MSEIGGSQAPLSPSPPCGGGVGERGRSAAERSNALGKAKHMRSNSTDAEHRLWQLLRAKRLGGSKFRRQVPIGPYIADFACHAAKLVVEADGGQHSEETDAERDGFLSSRGYRVLRFWNNDILTNEEGVLTAILAALEAPAAASSRDDRTPLPNPSPSRGEGH